MRILRDLPRVVAARIIRNGATGIKLSSKLEVLAIGKPSDLRPDLTTAYNTYMRFKIGDFVGQIAYNRIDAATYYSRFLTGQPTGMVITKKDSVLTYADIHKDVCDYLAQDFEVDEWVADPVVINADNTVTITASPTNLWFTGSVNVPLQVPTKLIDGKPVICVSPIYRDFEATSAATGTDGYDVGLLTYDLDYSDFSHELLAMDVVTHYEWNTTSISQANGQMARLAEIMASVDGLPWHHSTATSAQFNLYAGGLIYTGLADAFILPTIVVYGGSEPMDNAGILNRTLHRPRKDKMFVSVFLVNGKYGYGGVGNYSLVFLHHGPNREPEYYEAEDRPPLHHWKLTFDDRRNYGTDDTECGIGGSSMPVYDTYDPVHMVNYNAQMATGIGTTNSGAGPKSLGVKLPVNKDFTFSFRMAVHGNNASTATYEAAFMSSANANLVRGTMAAGRYQNWGLPGSWPLAKEMYLVSERHFPHTATVTFVRRGKYVFVYMAGVLAQTNYGDSEIEFIDLIRHYNADQYVMISDIRYFDYALTSDQVRRMITGGLDLNKTFPAVTPAKPPLHHWPLDGKLDNLGTSGLPLNGVFDWKNVGSEQWAARPSGGGGGLLGVSLPIDVDFTFQFEYYAVGDAANGTILSGADVTVLMDGNLRVYAGMVYPLGSTHYIFNDATNRMTPNSKNVWTIVNRKGYLYVYINGVLERAYDRGISGVAANNAWTNFGRGGDYMNVGDRTRQWKYWDVALTPEQVAMEFKRGLK